MKQFGQLALRKQNSTDSEKGDNVINFDRIRHLESGKRERTVERVRQKFKLIFFKIYF